MKQEQSQHYGPESYVAFKIQVSLNYFFLQPKLMVISVNFCVLRIGKVLADDLTLQISTLKCKLETSLLELYMTLQMTDFFYYGSWPVSGIFS